MGKVAFVCPSCRGTFPGPPSLAGESAPCPKCGADIDRWPPGTPAATSAPAHLIRTPRPQEPVYVMLAGIAGLVILVVMAFDSGGVCLGSAAIGAAIPLAMGVVMLCRGSTQAVVWGDYLAALNMLKGDPTNPDLRQQALAIGREYAALTIGFDGKPEYTEAAIANDIDAACAGR